MQVDGSYIAHYRLAFGVARGTWSTDAHILDTSFPALPIASSALLVMCTAVMHLKLRCASMLGKHIRCAFWA